VSCFFLLSFGEEGGKKEDFFHFPFVPIGSRCIPHGFSFKFWGGGGKGGGGQERKIFFSFFLRSNRFSMCSPWVFPIVPCFNPICFAQSPPFITYIDEPKEEALHLSIESSIFVKLYSFKFFLPRPIKFNKKRVGLVKGKGQAKNGDKLFWEEKFHVANGNAQAHTECALHFFLLSLKGERFRGGYFLVFSGSHYVDHPTIHSL
jgi:hypothetical protein